MTKKELYQIYYINKEIEMWQRELEEIYNLQSPKVDGLPHSKKVRDITGEKAIKAAQIQAIIEGLLVELQVKRKEIYEFISTLDDSLMRQIIVHRCLSLCTWEEVTAYIGGNNTAESVRKMFDRYFEK